MKSDSRKDMIGILTEELRIYETVLIKTFQQMDSIRNMDIDKLTTILCEKDSCITKIETIEKKLYLLLNKESQNLIQDKDISECLRNIEETINIIMRIEENCYNELSLMQAGISEDIHLSPLSPFPAD